MRVERHRHHGVVADERGEFDHGAFSEAREKLRAGRIRHRLEAVQLDRVPIHQRVAATRSGREVCVKFAVKFAWSRCNKWDNTGHGITAFS